MAKCREYQKYIILVNNIVIAVEAIDKTQAIDKFKNEFKNLYELDWSIKKVQSEININNEYIYY